MQISTTEPTNRVLYVARSVIFGRERHGSCNHIRTLVFMVTIHFQQARNVADRVPETEYEEVLAKKWLNRPGWSS